MFLTDAELRELTGYQRYADQRRWLSTHGWRFEVSGIGRPVVARSQAESRVGAQESASVAWSPNIAALAKGA